MNTSLPTTQNLQSGNNRCLVRIVDFDVYVLGEKCGVLVLKNQKLGHDYRIHDHENEKLTHYCRNHVHENEKLGHYCRDHIYENEKLIHDYQIHVLKSHFTGN
jgi:hypothetical protein